MAWPEAVLLAYIAVLALLSLNGIHRLWLVWIWSRRRSTPAPPFPAEPPTVTVQIPLFNERYVAERVVGAAGRLRYPRDRLQVQILDDSTDDTTERAVRAAEALNAEGVDAVVVHRADRTGFKAGALENGLRTATGEVVAIFDADFVPDPDFLERTIPWFADPAVGMVQARWSHLNAADSWLTGAQSILLDGHFVIEHTARFVSGRWFNFNGTAGVWRRAAIASAGGWQHDTLTEDLDLSYRAQLAGWTFRYLWWVTAPAELPPTMAAFKSQQHRWARGSVQTARKLLVPIWRAPVPLATRLEATAHLCANFSYPLVVVLALLLPIAVAARAAPGPWVSRLAFADFLLFPFAMSPFIVFFAAAVVGAGGGWRARGFRLVQMPLVLALGLGLALSQTRAVAYGLWGPIGTFVRTPKHGGTRVVSYRIGERGLAGLEIALAAYLCGGCALAIREGYLGSMPFLVLFAAGYGVVGLSSIRLRHA